MEILAWQQSKTTRQGGITNNNLKEQKGMLMLLLRQAIGIGKVGLESPLGQDPSDKHLKKGLDEVEWWRTILVDKNLYE